MAIVSALKRILLFGTSANPPTGDLGHQGLVRWAAQAPQLRCFAGPPDEVWVLPVFRHAFEEKREMPAFKHRLAMAERAFLPLSGQTTVRVSDAERGLAELWAEQHPHARPGTIDLIRWLDTKHPDVRWALLLGADTYQDLMADRWKESQKLRSRVGLVVVQRTGEPEVGKDEAANSPSLGLVSSSALRRSRDPELWKSQVDPGVWDYIQEHGLYGFGDEAGEAR